MKRLATVILAIILCLCLTACGERIADVTSGSSTQPGRTEPTGTTTQSTDTTETTHEHTYEEVVTEPTCTEKGYTMFTCACGDSYIDHEVSETGHMWDEGVVTKESTEEEAGELLYTCTACGETEIQEIPPLNHEHDYTDPVVVEPTCTEGGYTVYTCSCGNSYVDDETAALGHNYATEVTEPTCTDQGYTAYTCQRCQDSYISDVVEAKGHNYLDATCTAPKICIVCGHTSGKELGHTWDDGKVIKEATESEDGEMLYTCVVCGDTMTQVIPSLEHEHSYYAVVTTPTCTEGGYTTHTCRCGDSYITDETAALGHDWNAATCTTAKTCARCQETEGSANGHSWMDATCTTAKKCSTCGQKDGDALGHDYEAVVTEPTCTQQGYTTHTCTRCNDQYVSGTVAALGHDYADATCTTPKTCNRCGRTTGNALDHEYTTEVIEPIACIEQGYTRYTCKNCGFSYVTDYTNGDHQFGQWQVTMEPTCTDAGFRYRECSHCGAAECEDIPAAGHQYQTFVIAPTCTEQGFTVDACDICDASNYYDYVEATGHTEVADPGYPATCTTTGRTDGTYCSVCDTVLKAQEVIPTIPHTEVVDKGYPATCISTGLTDGTHCSSCGAVVVAQKVIPTVPHTEVVDKGYPATCSATGLTDGTHCSVCGMVIWAQEVIPTVPHTIVTSGGTWPTETSDGLTPSQSCTTCGMVVAQPVVIPSYAAVYNDDFYYEQLGKEANGEALQELYRMMDMAAMSFHFDTSIDLTENTVATFCYTDLGLSQEEACHVWMFYKQDHPLYYWISTWVAYSEDSIMLQTEPDHWQGLERAEVNALICGEVEHYLALVEDETSSYIIALVFHDSIITAIDYAYDDNGYPQDALWAHRVLGVFDGRGAVCEGYAQVYQLLLNAAGVENIYVVGDAGVPGYDFNAHAWNLVQLDDGGWYWCDLTWDDTPLMEFGVVYRYFCVNDTQNVNWYDGGIISEAFSFYDSHEPSYTLGSWEWEVVLPDRSTEQYQDPEDAVVREIFTVGNFTYCVNGYNTVRLTAVNYNESGTLYLPETVTYNGRTYTVVEIGRMFNGLVEKGNVIPSEFTAVHLPKTLRFIWDGAIFGHSVEAYTVDPENPCFTAKDGVLYTTNYYTLVQYPCNAPYVERYVIPDETIYIANGSLRNIRNPFGELVIGKNVLQIGVPNWGYGYYDGTQEGYRGWNEVTGELSDLHRMAYEAGTTVTITVDPENALFAVVDGIVYELRGGLPAYLVTVADTSVKEIVLPADLASVDMTDFQFCVNLERIYISAGTSISGYVINVPNLKEVIFQGTMEQWEDALFGDFWKEAFWQYAPEDLCVICTDGTIENPNKNP